ncbi:MAG: lysophospholipid acyltransferase family protein [Acidobacteriota bacterium]|nr:MAG: lysophospholipid acyltransferase family protein [Acidobacteriota bacterium]
MRQTIFDSPIISGTMRALSWLIFRLFGWRLVGPLPEPRRYVLIAAPHTSNWDFPVMLLAAFGLRAKAFWIGKNSLFRKPFGALFRWLGGLPVDRSTAHNVVNQASALFNEEDELILAIAPEGTRKKVSSWKTGFYYIALNAKVPIVFGFIDYGRKRTGAGPLLMPTGDIEEDMKVIRAFYGDIRGKYHDQTGSIEIESK